MTSSLFNDFFLLYLLDYQFILSLPVRRGDGFGYRSIEESNRRREREKRSLKSWQTVVASSSFSSSCFIFSISFSVSVLVRLVFTTHLFSECYFLCDTSSKSKKNDFPTRPSFFSSSSSSFSPPTVVLFWGSIAASLVPIMYAIILSRSLSSSNHHSLSVLSTSK